MKWKSFKINITIIVRINRFKALKELIYCLSVTNTSYQPKLKLQSMIKTTLKQLPVQCIYTNEN